MASRRLSSEICLQLTEDIVVKLKQCGIVTVGKLVCSSVDAVSKCSGVTCSEVEAIQHALMRVHAPYPVSGRTLLREAQQRMCIFPFGVDSIDELLKGGVYTAELTELWGVAGSGKTRLCLSLAGGVVSSTPYSVAYIDGSAGSFDSTHLWACLGASQDGEKLLEKVRVFTPFSVYELLSLVESIQHHVSNQSDGFYASLRVLVIDPVTFFLAPLLTPYHGQGQVLMAQLVTALRILAQTHHIAVLYCNNVVSSGDGGVKPALGQTWSRAPCTRLHLAHTRTGRSVTISRSPRQRTAMATNFTFPLTTDNTV